jgi:DNA repair ATPase RecN
VKYRIQRLTTPTAIGRALVAVAAVGVLVGLAGMVVAWRLAGRLQTGVDESLAVAEESLATTEKSIVVITQVLTDLEGLIGTLETTVVDTAATVEAAAGAIDNLESATPALTNGLTSVRNNIDQIAEVVDTLESVMNAVGRIPGLPDYNPDEPLADALRRLRPDLDRMVEALGGVNAGIGQLDDNVQPLVTDLRELEQNLAALRADVTNSRTLLTEYQRTAVRASDVANDVRADLGNDLTQTRVLIIAAGILFIVGQIVPLALSRLFFAQVVRDELVDVQQPPL